MYEDQSSRGTPSEKAQFEYAICLARSKPEVDIRHGIALLEGNVVKFKLSYFSSIVKYVV